VRVFIQNLQHATARSVVNDGRALAIVVTIQETIEFLSRVLPPKLPAHFRDGRIHRAYLLAELLVHERFTDAQKIRSNMNVGSL
jgi:hypothetical protein